MARYLAAGAFLGLASVVLVLLGNPVHTGLCVSCFMQNTAGALGFHGNVRMQYLRPELLGIVLGAALVAWRRGELKATTGASPLLRFAVGNLLMVGCAVFMGCPIKLVLRLAAGDLPALAGLAGLIIGVAAGVFLVLEGAFRTGRSRPAPAAGAAILPGVVLVLLALQLAAPGTLLESTKGAGAEHAPVWASLGVGLVAGALAQPTRFCITAALARMFLWGGRELPGCPRHAGMLAGLGVFFAVALGASVASGQFQLAPLDQAEGLGWAFLGMLLVGAASVMVRGCPFRQLVVAGQGDADASAAVLGMVSGAAVVENWHLGSTAAGTPVAGKVAVLLGLAILVLLGLAFRDRTSEEET